MTENRFLESTKADARKNLLDFKRIMDELQIPFCLMDGTLLGAVLVNDFQHGDYDDNDVAILHTDYDRMATMAPSNKFKIISAFGENGFTMSKSPFCFEGLLEGLALFRGGNHIDIMRMHIVDDVAYNLARCWRPNMPGVVAYVYPRKCFDTFDQIEFQGETFHTPHDVEKYLVVRYDTNWKTYVPREQYDYLSPKQVPCLRTEWPREKK